MPELPEVETMRRGVLPIVGSSIAEVRWPRCRLKPILVTPRRERFRRQATGRRVTGVERLGKRVLLRLDNNSVIAFEPRMTGLLLTAFPPDDGHVRLRLELQGGAIPLVQFWDRRGLGTVSLLTPQQLFERWGPHRLGPDALDISPTQLQQRFRGSRRAIKVALLDQAALAGIGNLYASEILHRAKVHPETACDRLTVRKWQQLHTVMLQVLEEAIRYEGSTLSDGTYRNVLNGAGGYQNCHRVYDREGQSCPTCRRGTIRRIVQAQRSTFYCPSCQRKK